MTPLSSSGKASPLFILIAGLVLTGLLAGGPAALRSVLAADGADQPQQPSSAEATTSDAAPEGSTGEVSPAQPDEPVAEIPAPETEPQAAPEAISLGDSGVTAEPVDGAIVSDTPAAASTPEQQVATPAAETEVPQKERRRTDALKKRLATDGLSVEKQGRLLGKLEKLQQRQEKKEIKALKTKLKGKRDEMNAKIKEEAEAPVTEADKARRQALREELKTAGKARLEALAAHNEALAAETTAFIAAELADFTVADKAAVAAALEPDFVFELQEEGTTTPFSDDPELSGQWALPWVLNEQALPAPAGDPDAPVVIALIDSGVDITHADLSGRFWTDAACKDELNAPIAGGCSLGGYDFVDEDTNPSAEDGATHGTLVAGILGAKTNNSLGMAALSAPNVKIMALKVAEDGFLSAQDIARAIDFAVNNDADIINMSFGGPTYSTAIYDAVTRAQAQGILVTAAAGNYASNNDISPIYPANYALDNIISVAALAQDGSLATFSNYGQTTVDIAAPGVSILSTLPGSAYGTASGTSFAAPLVASLLSRYVGAPEAQASPAE